MVIDFKQDILSPVATDFAAMDHLINEGISSKVGLVMSVSKHVVEAGGKRMRPIMCLLAARACGVANMQHAQHLAAIIEMLHTATLVHDDVVDESNLRRGRPTANATWNNQTAVLVGDFLIARAFDLLVDLNNITLLKDFSTGTCEIAEGEVLQLQAQHQPDTTEETYLRIIHGKTEITQDHPMYKHLEKVDAKEFDSPMKKIIAETQYGPAGKTMETSGVFTEDASKYNLKNIAEMEAKVAIEAEKANKLQIDSTSTEDAVKGKGIFGGLFKKDVELVDSEFNFKSDLFKGGEVSGNYGRFEKDAKPEDISKLENIRASLNTAKNKILKESYEPASHGSDVHFERGVIKKIGISLYRLFGFCRRVFSGGFFLLYI
jgi:octaprenyl-diphosphate synthase